MSAAELRGRLGRWHHLRFTGEDTEVWRGQVTLCSHTVRGKAGLGLRPLPGKSLGGMDLRVRGH